MCAAWQKNVGATHESMPMRPTQAEPSTSGALGGVPEPDEISWSPPVASAASSLIVTLFAGEPLTRAVPSTSSMSPLAASSFSAAMSSSRSRSSPAARITARPLLKVVWEPDAPMSYGPDSVSW